MTRLYHHHHHHHHHHQSFIHMIAFSVDDKHTQFQTLILKSNADAKVGALALTAAELTCALPLCVCVVCVCVCVCVCTYVCMYVCMYVCACH